MRWRERKGKKSGSVDRDRSKYGSLGAPVKEADACDLEYTVAVFRNQQVTNSWKKLAKAEPSLRLHKLKDKVIISRIVDTHTVTIFGPGIKASCTKDDPLRQFALQLNIDRTGRRFSVTGGAS